MKYSLERLVSIYVKEDIPEMTDERLFRNFISEFLSELPFSELQKIFKLEKLDFRDESVRMIFLNKNHPEHTEKFVKEYNDLFNRQVIKYKVKYEIKDE